MTVQEFAGQYRLRVRRDTCGEEIISGKKFCKDMPDRLEYRSHIYDVNADSANARIDSVNDHHVFPSVLDFGGFIRPSIPRTLSWKFFLWDWRAGELDTSEQVPT
jgi:hypothetical protein